MCDCVEYYANQKQHWMCDNKVLQAVQLITLQLLFSFVLKRIPTMAQSCGSCQLKEATIRTALLVLE